MYLRREPLPPGAPLALATQRTEFVSAVTTSWMTVGYARTLTAVPMTPLAAVTERSVLDWPLDVAWLATQMRVPSNTLLTGLAPVAYGVVAMGARTVPLITPLNR